MAVYYVSTTGNDLAAGTSLSTAFRTLERARDAMRANTGDDTALVRGGVYELATPLLLNQLDDGSSFAAMTGQTVTLSGGHAINNWTAGANGIWTATVNAADMHQLTVNGARMAEARYPNETPNDPIQGGWLFGREPAAGTNPLQQLTYDPADFAPGQLATGTSVRIFTNASWASEVLTVQSVDTANHVITFSQPASYELGTASRYYVQGRQPLLDAAGEWWFDTTAKLLHFKAPPGFDGTGAVASGLNDIIQIAGANNIRIAGFTFSDSASGHAYPDRASAGIRIDGAQNVVIENNSFQNLIKGVHAEAYTIGAVIRGNDFAHLWASAIDLDHGSKQNQILSNNIRRTGEVFVAPAAINMNEGAANTIAHNLIRDIPRNGIQWVNYDPILRSGGNVVEFNTILRSGQQTSDGGAIYVYSSPDRVHDGDVVRHNRIVDTGGLETQAGGFVPGAQFSHGIYLDDFTNRAVITGNFIQTSVRGGIYLHGGSDNAVFNNISLDNKDIGIQLFEIGSPMTGNQISGNIVGMSGGSGNIVELNPAYVSGLSLRNNYYLDADPTSARFSGRDFAAWRALGFDAGTDLLPSTVFRNPSAGDYRLKPGALPLTEGFNDLQWEQMSLFRGGRIVTGSLGRDTLAGGAGNDVLFGLAGDDALRGGAGQDELDGGPGNDRYWIDNPGDAVFESANSGIDIVFSSVDHALKAHVETLILQGSTPLFGAGNGLNNIITGNAGNNTLLGNDGNDALNGGVGNDVMSGGAGNDTFTADSSGDVVIENANQGTDRVLSSVSFVLGAHVEMLWLTGLSSIDGTGNALSNSLRGNDAANVLSGGDGNDVILGGAGNDSLLGGAGNDQLIGGLGADRFVFANHLSGRDVVADFVSGSDRLAISSAGFGVSSIVLRSGPTPSVIGTSGQFLYDTDDGRLSFDPDGSGILGAIWFATLTSGPSLSSADFAVTP